MFKGVENLFVGNDLIVGNLEGTVTNNESISLKNNEILRFTFDPVVLNVLKENNFGLLSLANNHSMDFYKDGYETTKENIKNNNIEYFGSAQNTENLSKKILIKDKTFCFFAHHDLYTCDERPVIEELKKLKNDCDKKIVYPHWGTEYVSEPVARQKDLAEIFINAGADLIIGTHPHVVQSVEIINNKPIFYSLGNFIFDQNFSFETTHSFALKIYFYKEKTIYEMIPFKVDRGVLGFVDENVANKIFEPIAKDFKSKKGRENNSVGFILKD